MDEHIDQFDHPQWSDFLALLEPVAKRLIDKIRAFAGPGLESAFGRVRVAGLGKRSQVGKELIVHYVRPNPIGTGRDSGVASRGQVPSM